MKLFKAIAYFLKSAWCKWPNKILWMCNQHFSKHIQNSLAAPQVNVEHSQLQGFHVILIARIFNCHCHLLVPPSFLPRPPPMCLPLKLAVRKAIGLSKKGVENARTSERPCVHFAQRELAARATL